MEKAGLQENGLRLALVSNVGSVGEGDINDSASDDSVEGGERTGEGSNSASSLGLTVPVVLRLHEEGTAHNKGKLVQAMGESMKNDISRNFIYGVSIEDDRVSLWYSTRNTTVKATSFSYIKRPDLLVRIFVSLFSADRDALGYESHITRLADGSYLYELDGIAANAGDLKSSQRLRSKAGPKQEPSFFFKTTHVVSAGNSRIWKAVEVMSKSNMKPKHRGREVILKDTWVDVDSATEFDLQRRLFQDIDILKQSDWESLPILKGIPPDREEFHRLRGYLKDDSYKSLFLRYDERMHYAGQSTKSLSPEQVWNPAITPGVAHTLAGNLEQHCRTTTRPHPLKDGFVPNPRLTSRRRCFFIFPDTCKRVSDLPTLGDAMDVLNQAYYALLLMFCAGWVHRDISDGNILATEVDGQWIAKLSDLEYAKKVSSNLQRSPEPKTGTPYFMAYEIQSSNFICPPAPISQGPPFAVWGEDEIEEKNQEEPPACVVHSFFHDIESLCWLILWIITSRVGCDASRVAAQIVFTSTPTVERYKVLRHGIPESVGSTLRGKAPHTVSQSPSTCGSPSVRVLSGSDPRLSKRKTLHDTAGLSMGLLPPEEGDELGQAGPSKRMRTSYESEENECAQDHYFLPASNTSILDEVVKQLRRKRVLIHRPKLPMAKTSTPTQHPAATTSNYRLSGSESQEQPFPLVLRGFVNRASEGRMTRSQSSVEKLWTKLENLATDIRQCMETAGVQCTGLELSLLPDSRSDSGDDIEDAISESFVETDDQRSGHKPSSYASLDMIVPVAVRVNGECIAQNREQLMRAMSDILEGDIARNFTYGISIEDDCVSLWYSTRKTTIKATSFSYIERPDLLIRVFVSLFSTDREALGYESHITRLADGSYLYELDGITAKADDLQSSQRLRSKATTHLVSRGHTQIWQAVEVISKSNPKAKPKCREIILKDTWVDADAMAEFDLQGQLFHDIDVLRQSDWESLPILSCIPRDRPEFVRLHGYLQDDTYKSLFLQYDGRMRYTSPSEKSIHSEKIWKASNTHPPTGNPEPRKGTTRPDLPDPKPPSVSPKKRCFFVFPDICTRLSDLPSIGDAMSVLTQAYFALLIMFCAGWVHRDISDGNILAIEVDGKWAAKLADLEFAKKLSPNAGSPDPKIGTPYFMAYEIQSSRLLCHLIPINYKEVVHPDWGRGPKASGQLTVSQGEEWGTVRHTVLHDIESLWWFILWIITSRVGCEPSRAAAKLIFQATSTPTTTRSNSLFVGLPRDVTSSLHGSVKPIASALEHFRARLYHDCCRNTQEMRLDYTNFAPICAVPLIFFKNIEDFRGVWGVLPVRQSQEDAEAGRLRTQTVTSVSLEHGNNEDQPGPSKRRRIHSRRGAKARRKA
ncbi:hypothetical protein DFP72DRAFT_1005642 [Ephemerocybe angulata]|uniref:Fungal-type protein kinase domain-containing protein n=1 Tax=Ephemerocybe angulata TaxID=980116 RepID=A0A8H6I4H2_9AGAR|nr:hypothetical protein DFP72DRAFT_1005642 [Tulosesus angulatus]